MCRPGTIAAAHVCSPTLGKPIAYNLYLPAGYELSRARYPVVYLLHGRGDTMSAWTCAKHVFDRLIDEGVIPALIAIMPDAPSSSRASYYVDSRYAGAGSPGEPVETAFICDLVPHVDAAYRTVANRAGRAIAGYSMGGYGALRYTLAHAELFGSSVVLSPAVYTPLPPAGSSAREFGAFGSGAARFVESIYQEKNYPALLARFAAKGLPLHMFIAVGNNEYRNPAPADSRHDLDIVAGDLYAAVARVGNITSKLSVLDGGHGWEVWEPGIEQGLTFVQSCWSR